MKLVRNKNLVSIVNSLVQLIVTLFSGILIVRLWGAEKRGEIYYFTQLGNTIALFLSFGLGPALLLSYKKGLLKKEQLTFILFRYSFFLFLLIILFLGSDFFFNIIPTSKLEFWEFLNLLIFIYLTALTLVFSLVLMIYDEGINKSSIISIIGNLTFLSLLIFVIFTQAANSILGMLAMTISVLIKLSFQLSFYFKKGIKMERVSMPLFVILVKDSFILFINNFLITNILRVDTFILNRIDNVGTVGRYSVAVNLSELVLLIPAALGVVLFPSLISAKGSDKVLLAKKYSRINVFVSFFVSIIVLFSSSFILSFFYGIFSPDVTYSIMLLLPGLIFFSVVYSLSNYLGAIGIPHHATIIYIVGLIINIFSNLYFISTYSMVGAALASLISYMAVGLLFIVYIKRTIPKSSYMDFVLLKVEDFSALIGYFKK